LGSKVFDAQQSIKAQERMEPIKADSVLSSKQQSIEHLKKNISNIFGGSKPPEEKLKEIGDLFGEAPEESTEQVGEQVVDDVVSKVESALGPTNGMLKDIAKVESKFGMDRNTFKGQSNGIWQIDDIGFKATQDTVSHPNLEAQFEIIQNEFGIDWMSVTKEELNDPLIAAIAARLFLLNIPKAIPKGKKAQANYWKKYFNTSAGKGTPEAYLKRVNKNDAATNTNGIEFIGFE